MNLLIIFKRIKTLIILFYKGFIKLDERSKFKLAERIFNLIFPKYLIGDWGKISHEDFDFLSWYKKFEGDNPHRYERLYSLKELIKLTNNIIGDTAELGVYKGASSYLILNNSLKKHHMFDSWEGLSKPAEVDGDWWLEGSLDSSIETCMRNLDEFDSSRLHYYKGWIPETFKNIPKKTTFSFIHFDLDLYEPTKDGLSFFYNRLNVGGIMIFDDYTFNACPGVKLAVDEFFNDKKEEIISLPFQAFIIKK